MRKKRKTSFWFRVWVSEKRFNLIWLLGPALVLVSEPCRILAESGTNEVPAQPYEIVVTATRMESDIRQVPAVVYKLDLDRQIREGEIRTTPEMLSGIPSVLVQKTSYGQGSPYLRGFTGFRTLCLVDGIRLNNSVFREGPNQYWNTVDPFGLEASELIMGPSSVLYGSDAIGGTLNVLTMDPLGAESKEEWNGRMLYKWMSAGPSHIGRIELEGKPIGGMGLTGGMTVKDFNDLRGGSDVGKQPHTGYDERDFDVRLDYMLAQNAVLTMAHQAVDQDDIWRTHKTIYGIHWRGLTNGSDRTHSFDQARVLTYMKFSAHDLEGVAEEVQITVSRQLQKEDLYRVRKNFASDRDGFDVSTWGVGVQMKSPTYAGTLVYGGDWYRDIVDSYSLRFNADGTFAGANIQGPVADDAIYDLAGFYLEDMIALPGNRLTITPGVRCTYARAEAKKVMEPITGSQISIENDWSTAVASMRAVYSIDAAGRLVAFGGVGQGFRAPNLSDLSRFDIARSNEIETPSPSVKPERYVTSEVGMKAMVRNFNAQFAAYYTIVDDMIVRTPTGRTIEDAVEVTKLNSGDGYICGGEADIRCRLPLGWSISLAGSMIQGKVDTYLSSQSDATREYISRLMPATLTSALRWERPDGKLWCEIVCAAADRSDKLSPDDKRDTQRIPPGGTPGYCVFHARGGVALGKDLKLSVSLENIFDEDYRIHGSGVNEPGRNLELTVSMAF